MLAQAGCVDTYLMPATTEEAPATVPSTNAPSPDDMSPQTDDSNRLPPRPTGQRAPTESRTMLTALRWLAVGAMTPLGFAGLALLLTIATIKDSTDEYAGLTFLVTVPIGYVVGIVFAMITARRAEIQSKSINDLLTRTELVFLGVVLHVVVVVTLQFVFETYA